MKMEQKKVSIVGNTVELSETKTYIELTNRVCYYDAPNLNDVVLPIDGALEKAQTLVEQPLVARYKKINNQDDLGGHECSVDSKGNIIFGTENIGVHTSVEIKDDDVVVGDETKTLPCLFAKCKVWTRNKNVVSAIKRLFSEGKLHSSWEILTSNYEYRDGLKYLLDYVFEADALLGSRSSPAYGACATTLALAEEDADMLIAESLANDIYSKNKEDNMPNEENVISENTDEKITNEPEKENVDTSKCDKEKDKEKSEDKLSENSEKVETPVIAELTDRDIRDLINKQLDDCSYVCMLFPADSYVLVHNWNQTELEFTKYNYTVVDNTVTISDPEVVRLTVSVAEINSVIAEKNEAIIKANEEINVLKSEAEKLNSYKEIAEKAQAEKESAELAKKQDKLKNYALKSNYITSEEIEGENADENIQRMISEADENGIKNLIVDRLMATKTETVVSETTTKEEVITASIVDDDKGMADYKTIMNSFLKK